MSSPAQITEKRDAGDDGVTTAEQEVPEHVEQAIEAAQAEYFKQHGHRAEYVSVVYERDGTAVHIINIGDRPS